MKLIHHSWTIVHHKWTGRPDPKFPWMILMLAC
ncbi:MAG: hypothetical protein QOI88_2468 [Gammaproteobacteria bacterium]|jgi:hypothetical protein|nr:hypothetical protein [Gammaproteobacteria bacterium]